MGQKGLWLKPQFICILCLHQLQWGKLGPSDSFLPQLYMDLSIAAGLGRGRGSLNPVPTVNPWSRLKTPVPAPWATMVITQFSQECLLLL